MLAAYHHGANKGVTGSHEGASLLSKSGRDGEPEGRQERRNEHEEEERRTKRRERKINESGGGTAKG
jgi:hypothetical protein